MAHFIPVKYEPTGVKGQSGKKKVMMQDALRSKAHVVKRPCSVYGPRTLYDPVKDPLGFVAEKPEGCESVLGIICISRERTSDRGAR